MSDKNQSNLHAVDWDRLPAPKDDGSADHLTGSAWPDINLPSTTGKAVNLSTLQGMSIVFAYPMTAQPGVPLPDNWDMTPGARGCTPQACSFRDAQSELIAAGADYLFGLSVQDTDYQKEAVERMHLPYPLLSDHSGGLRSALNPPTLNIAGMTLFQRLTYVVCNGQIEKIWFPVFPPDKNVDEVLNWLRR